jgi:Mlc titration factor MtfA (ptsG expression regulator)
VFGWLRHRRRKRLPPFPASWADILAVHVPFRSRLTQELQQKLDHATQVLVAEKNWEGCGGLTLTDEHRVTIAAHASRLVLGFENDFFEEVPTILVYPTAYQAPTQNVLAPGIILETQSGRLGEAWYRGPVILAWSDVRDAGHGRNRGRNVVLHEFAHHLDMRNGRSADGVPVLESAMQAKRWLAVTSREYQRLRRACQFGQSTALDCYGATNMAEFFAVATEVFFEAPNRLRLEWPELYRVLTEFYRQSLLEEA